MVIPVEYTTGPPIYRVPKGRMVLGEGPIYRASDSTLHWFDPLDSPSELYILPVDPDTGSPKGEAKVFTLEDSITVAAFRKNKPGSYIAAYYQGVCFLDEATGEFEILREIILTSERDQLRFNDGGVDAAGRFWLAEIDITATKFPLGQIPENHKPRGRLWRYDPDGSLHLMLSGGLVCGNGVKWSQDNKTMYLNDSVGQKITALDFDLSTGALSNQRTLVDFKGTTSEPDGMVIDNMGNLWVSVYGSSHLMHFSPEGKLLEQVKLPAMCLTCPTWGGKNYDILYITTARDLSKNPDPNDDGGQIYKFLPDGARGQPNHEFAG
ncbi:hypothetical protein N7523_008925 [Penicillium sp. IBT 18751x]|nr:hypothetical protein N7523_008925 [Penicillium sp. IBT 18751x]